MKSLRTIILGLLTFVMLGGTVSSLAYAEEGVLPVQAKPFKISGTTLVMETLDKDVLLCKTFSMQGTFLPNSSQHAEGPVTLTGCTGIAGLQENSLGDPVGTVLFIGLTLVCLVNSSKLQFAILIEPTETVHTEVPTLKVLLLTKGAVIAENVSANEGTAFEMNLEGKEGDQKKALECEVNGKKLKHTLEGGVDTKSDVMMSANTKFTLTYAEKITMMDT